MDQLLNRKRRVDSDQEDENVTINKKPLLDSPKYDQTTASNTNGNDNDDDDQRDAMTMNYAPTIEQDTPLSPYAADCASVETIVPYPYLVLINMEVTCDENPTNPAAVQVSKENAEIIQLSFAIVNSANMKLVDEQVIHVKPERTPLTQFCTQITGITSDTLASATTLQDAVDILDSAIQTEILDRQLEFCFVTHGGWLLRIQLSREARDKKLALPEYLAHPRMFDLKQELQRWQGHHPETHLRTTSLKELCDTFQLPLVGHGDSYSGDSDNDKKINDSDIDILATTTSVIRYLTKFRYNDVFVHPIDTASDLQQFNDEESLTVHLAGLPYEVTQGELEAWFSSNGLRPARMWMMQMTEQIKPSLSGFVVFTQHEDAVNALLLNGRSFVDRVIEVSPSSDRVVEAAAAILSPFPLQAKARQVRPGDWNCPNCSFHNFASRRHCFKCNAENPSHTSSAIATGGAPTGPAGASGGELMANTPNGTPSSNNGLPPPPPSSSSTLSSSTQPPAYTSTVAHHTPGSHHQSTPFTSGDWICASATCGFLNYSSRAQCLKCGSYRPNNTGNVPSATPSSQNAGFASHHQYHPPRPHHPANFRPGDWFCSCGFQNFASRMSCLRCLAPNPASTPSQPPTFGTAVGSSDGSIASLGSYGYDNGAANASYGGNAYTSSYGTPPAGNTMAPGTGGHGFRIGDWYCPNCNSHNFASRFQCLKCHTAKPYTQAQSNPATTYSGTATGGYRGPPPMKSGDWVCRNAVCGFHNFAKRTYCGKCNTPNPDSSPYGAAADY